jgi:hypothetical protein
VRLTVAGATVTVAIAGLMGGGLWTRFVHDPTPGPHRITVVAPRGNDGVVAFRIDRFEGSPTPSAELVRAGRWVETTTGMVRLPSGSGRASYEGSVDEGAQVVFRTGADAGRAQLLVDGERRRVPSLRSPTPGERIVEIPFDARVPPAAWALLLLMIVASLVPAGAAVWTVAQLGHTRGRRVAGAVAVGGAFVGVIAAALFTPETSDLRALDRIGVALAVGIVAVLVVAALLGVRPPRVQVAEPATAAGRWRLTLLLGSVPFVGWLALHLLFWPGLMNPDMGIQWFELERTGLDDWHPYVVSVAVGVLRHVVDSPALPVLLQVTGASLLVGRIAAWTVWRGRSPWVAGATLVLLPLIPATGLFTVTLWKDAAFGIALLGLALIVWRIEDTDGRWLAQPQNVALATVTMAGVWLTRHNGWPIVIGTVVIMLVAHRRWWRPLGVAAGAAVLVALFVQLPLAGVLDVRANRQPSIVYVQHIANHVNRGTDLTRSDRKVLSTVFPLDRTWPYDCHSIQPTWSGPQAIPLRRFTHKSGELRSVLIDLALRNPAAELDHLACASEIVWKPWARDGETYFLEWSDTAGYVDYILRFYDDTPSEDPASPRAIARIYHTVVDRFPVWVLRPALYLYALFGAIAFAAWRRRSWGVARLAVPALLASIVLAALTLVQDVRFQYGVILTAVVLVPALVTVAARRDADDDAPLRWGAAAPD